MKKWLAGVVATVVSGLIIYSLTTGGGTRPDLPPLGLPSHAAPAPITISYHLRNMEESLAVVNINGREAGRLYVDKSRPRSSIDITLPRSGTYEYSVQARNMIREIVDDTGFELPLINDVYGRGTIEVEAGKEFILTTNTLQLRGGGNNVWVAKLTDSAFQRP